VADLSSTPYCPSADIIERARIVALIVAARDLAGRAELESGQAGAMRAMADFIIQSIQRGEHLAIAVEIHPEPIRIH
jgi:hypothetical protein